MRLLLLVPFLLPTTLLTAQRPTPSIEWQKRTATIEFGAVPVGKHTLAELPVGADWRLGNNEASTLRLEMPLLAGDTMVAPGAYRIGLQRTGDSTASLTVAGSGLGLLATGDGQIAGKLGKAEKPSKKLDIQWRKQGEAVHGNQPVRLTVTFGADEWIGDAVLLGGEAFAVLPSKGILWTVPAARLAADAATPVGQMVRGEVRWNIVVAKGEVKLVPPMQAPTEQFGFGEPIAPDAAKVLVGKVGQLEMKVDAEWPALDLISCRREEGLFLAAGYAKDRVAWILPEPKPGK